MEVGQPAVLGALLAAAALVNSGAVGQQAGEALSLTASAAIPSPLQHLLLSLWQWQVRAAARWTRRALGLCWLVPGAEWKQSVDQDFGPSYGSVL